MKLRVRAFGLSMGTVWGLGIFVLTLWAMMADRGRTLTYLEGYYVGYTVSFGGAIAGLVWGFVTGFIVGSALAWMYNKFHASLYKTSI